MKIKDLTMKKVLMFMLFSIIFYCFMSLGCKTEFEHNIILMGTVFIFMGMFIPDKYLTLEETKDANN